MTATRRLLRVVDARHRRLAAQPEAGTTMIELFVAMIMMTICGSIFTGAIISLYRTTDAAQAVTTSSQQINQAYQTLDRTVRYASAISTEGRSTGATATGDWYVELRNTTDGTERCTQLRLDIASGQLQRRTWRSSNVTGTLTAWQPLASGLTNGAVLTGDDKPFTTGLQQRQILTISMVAAAGPANGRKTSSSRFTLTAINSPINSTTATATNVCQQVGRP